MGIAFAEGAFGSAASQQILDGEIDWKRVVVDGTFSSIMEGVLCGVRNPGGITEGTHQYTPYTDDMKQFIYNPENGFDVFLEKKYIEIRKNGLDDISTIAKNTGLTEQEIIDMKKHVFLDTHELSFDGQPYQTQYRSDPELYDIRCQAVCRVSGMAGGFPDESGLLSGKKGRE